ncbi:MAG: hypothetical protein EHM57_07200 [Actinobacteria bacterium]|nr:MAG: hypothetical protein EHM57_07200 [Actinomycetota bacterium]
MNGRGALRFARYAFPPNHLGYCGPADSAALLEHILTGTSDAELRRLATGFAGAWPYLELIAAAAGRDDPLDPDVVEAYWLGNALLDAVPVSMMGNSLDDRFRRRAGAGWSSLEEAIPAGAVPHHSFHVFGVYPWVGLLRSGESEEPLRILDRCRIRTGTVQAVEGSSAAVRSRPLAWDGYRLDLGAPMTELVNVADDGMALQGGAVVTMHWDWICEVVSPAAAMRLEVVTRSQMELVNGLSLPGPAALLA